MLAKLGDLGSHLMSSFTRPPVAVPPRLCGGDIGKMGCQDAGGEKTGGL